MMIRTLAAGAALTLLALVAGCGDSAETDEPLSLAVEELEGTDAGEPFYSFDTPPVLEHYATPVYPDAAKRAGREGRVVVRVLVDAGGAVQEADVLKSDDPAFDVAALQAVREFRFQPARLDGQPVPSRVAVPIQFRLH